MTTRRPELLLQALHEPEFAEAHTALATVYGGDAQKALDHIVGCAKNFTPAM